MGSGGISPLVLGHLHTPISLLPGKEPFTHSVGGWVSPITDVNVFENIKIFCLCRESNRDSVFKTVS